MKFLAFDTSMAACSAAVVDTDRELPLASAWAAMERGHAEALAPMLKQVMGEAGLAFSDLDRIAVTIGPGTFTGVRIGLSMARGFGVALGIPVVGLDTLSAIAANVTATDTSVLVAADARKDEVYAACFEMGKRVSGPAVMAVSAACAGLAGGAIVLGSAADLAVAASGRNDLERSRAGDLPVAANFARSAAAMSGTMEMPSPLYLRAPDAKPQNAPLREQSLVSFQPAGHPDAELLANLYAECFDTPWTAEDFRQLLAMPGATAMMAVEHGEPLAFALFRQAADEAEIITIGTRPFARQRGLGKLLIDCQLADLTSQGVKSAFLEVAKSNSAAQALYRSCGFRDAGLRRGYYERGNGLREDAIVMRRDLAP